LVFWRCKPLLQRPVCLTVKEEETLCFPVVCGQGKMFSEAFSQDISKEMPSFRKVVSDRTKGGH
jgi:hypothetical protein